MAFRQPRGVHPPHASAASAASAASVALVAGAGVCAGVGSYFTGIIVGGEDPGTASAVFQPVVVIETLAFGWALLAAGLFWADAGARHGRLIAAGGDCSFGIYLAHPLVLQGALLLARAAGVLTAIRDGPAAVELAALLGVGVPLVYGVSWALVVLLRCTPLSLVLTGRQRHKGRITGPVDVASPASRPPAGAAFPASTASPGLPGQRNTHLRCRVMSRRLGVGVARRLRLGVVLLCALCMAATACAGATQVVRIARVAGSASTTSTNAIQVDGRTRTWEQIVPRSTPPGSAPIIVVLSGINATVSQEISRDKLVPYVNAGEAELIYRPASASHGTPAAAAGRRHRTTSTMPPFSRCSSRRSIRGTGIPSTSLATATEGGSPTGWRAVTPACSTRRQS